MLSGGELRQHVIGMLQDIGPSMPIVPHVMKVKTKKPSPDSRRKRKAQGSFAPKYRFDYSKSKKNRFASHVHQDATVVLLDPDVFEAFPTAESVNHALRLLVRVANATVRRSKKTRRRPI